MCFCFVLQWDNLIPQDFLVCFACAKFTCAFYSLPFLRFVVASMPTYFEEGKMNCIEDYSWNGKKNRIDVVFRMQVLYVTRCISLPATAYSFMLTADS